eukprot:gene5240-5902_t
MKLESKREGLKILMKDMDHCQMERDIYKNKVCQLQQELDELKEVIGGQWKERRNNSNLFSQEESDDKKIKTLTQLLQHIREENQALQNDLTAVRQLYSEAQRDNQLLRETLQTHESRKKESTSENRDKAWLVEQLEDAQGKLEDYKADLENLKDEKTDLLQESEQFKEKCRRLNKQLNYVLHNDERRLIDVDALLLENKYDIELHCHHLVDSLTTPESYLGSLTSVVIKYLSLLRYLKEVSKQHKEEKSIMASSVARYKEALDRRYNKANKLLAYLDVPVSLSQKAFRSHNAITRRSNSETIQELQRLTKTLTESLADKDLALTVQRKTNRVLGARVRELEKKLKTLEISGLWSHQGEKLNRHPGSEEMNDIQVEDEINGNDAVESANENDDEEKIQDLVSLEAEAELDNSCWDPYFEKFQDGQVKCKSLEEILVDIKIDGRKKGNSDSSNSGESISGGEKKSGNAKFHLEGRVLRRTNSCPD